jgi:hypothetical protein
MLGFRVLACMLSIALHDAKQIHVARLGFRPYGLGFRSGH